MLRAVPAMMRMPASSESGIEVLLLQLHDLKQLLAGDLADLVLVGLAEPLAMLAAFFSSTEPGGDFRMKVSSCPKDRDDDRRIIPFWSLVLALNSLQNAMMLTPCAPSAGPSFTAARGSRRPRGVGDGCNLGFSWPWND